MAALEGLTRLDNPAWANAPYEFAALTVDPFSQHT